MKRHSGWHVHFSPTSASWINQVERFFADLTERQIRRVACSRGCAVRTFSTKSGSFDGLKLSTRCGCKPNACQIRWIVEGA